MSVYLSVYLSITRSRFCLLSQLSTLGITCFSSQHAFPNQDRFCVPESLLSFPLQSQESAIMYHTCSLGLLGWEKSTSYADVLCNLHSVTNVTYFFSPLVCSDLLYFTYNTWRDHRCLLSRNPQAFMLQLKCLRCIPAWTSATVPLPLSSFPFSSIFRPWLYWTSANAPSAPPKFSSKIFVPAGIEIPPPLWHLPSW